MNHKIGINEPTNWCSMLTKKQLEMLELFRDNIFSEYGHRDIGRLTKESSNNAIQLALKQFEKEELVLFKRVGTSKKYKLNLENDKLYGYFDLIKYEDFPKSVFQSIETLKKEIEKYTLFYSLVIFGSYVKGEQKNKSDLDIALIIPDKIQENNMKIAKNMTKHSSLIELDVQIMTSDELFQMLVNKEANLGKEIAHKHRAVHNINIFYKILKEAIHHGFNY